MTHSPARTRPRCIGVALLLLLSGIATAEPPPVEEQSMGWVNAYNLGEDALAAFRRDHFSAALLARSKDAEWRASYREMKETLGILDIGDMRLHPGSAVLVGTTGTGEIVSLDFTFEDGKVARVAVRLGAPPSTSTLPPLDLPQTATADETVTAIDRYLRRLAADGVFSGVVLAARGDDILFQGAYGWATVRWQVPNKPSTRFDIGSITKTFTKVAVAKLLEKGRLTLDKTIADYLPDYPNAEIARQVTIGQLVSHTSGLGDVFTPAYFAMSKLRLRVLADYPPIYAQDPLRFAPGSGRAYSNYGYVVLGLIIEQVTGQSYFDFIQATVFDPAGMDRSGFFAADEPLPDIAMGHTRLAPGGHPSDTLLETTLRFPVRGAPDGQSHSPAIDLLRFDRALRNHRLLVPAYTRWVFGGPNPAAGGASTDPAPVTTGIGFAGGAPGINALLESGDGHTLVVLANLDEPIAEELGIERLLPILRRLW